MTTNAAFATNIRNLSEKDDSTHQISSAYNCDPICFHSNTFHYFLLTQMDLMPCLRHHMMMHHIINCISTNSQC